MRILFVLLFLSVQLARAESTESALTLGYQILEEFPEDENGINLIVTWPKDTRAIQYKLKISRESPSELNTEFFANRNLYFLKVFPGRLYHWTVQAIGAEGHPLSDPVPGESIFLKSSLLPKPETPSRPEPTQGTPEPGSEIIKQKKRSRTWLGLSLGGSFFQVTEAVTQRVDLNSLSFKFPSVRLFAGGRWNSWGYRFDYMSFPGSLEASGLASGGSDFQWTQYGATASKILGSFTVKGFPSYTGILISYEMTTAPFVLLDSQDGLHSRSVQYAALGGGISMRTQLTRALSLPFQLKIYSPLSANGEGGANYSVVSGNPLSFATGLDWRFNRSWTIGLDILLYQLNVNYEASLESETQSGNQNIMLMNTGFHALFAF